MGNRLRQKLSIQNRERLETKMAEVFKENMKGLSAELQRILLDDLVTAFQNRVNVLMRVQKKQKKEGVVVFGEQGTIVSLDFSKAVTEMKDAIKIKRLETARSFMATLKPTKLELERNAYVNLDKELVVKKTRDGKIILYEVNQ